ncbi:MAG: sigma factor, partial [Ignavibacteriota bacterium]
MSSDNKFVRSLIENAKQGNNAAIEQLFQMNLGKIYAFALRLTANKSLAESITKETFIEAWKKMNLVRSDASFLKWLSAITVYKTIDSLRSNKSKSKINHNELRELEISTNESISRLKEDKNLTNVERSFAISCSEEYLNN